MCYTSGFKTVYSVADVVCGEEGHFNVVTCMLVIGERKVE